MALASTKLHIWVEGTFLKLSFLFGGFVVVDEAILARTRFDFGRLRVLIDVNVKINPLVLVAAEGVEFDVKVVGESTSEAILVPMTLELDSINGFSPASSSGLFRQSG
ncbi:unnamed protein product [Vicia faba]|uniref:Uncharacterized protein n=1 Tax=Vicia faba TaxID=3906 RepID=A0AAV1AP04_VICFA|nr:unnamed protein product [Vicia faba]